LKSKRIFLLTICAAFGIGVILCVGTVARSQKAASVPATGKQWLAVMDTDHDGSVSKKEFNAYMDAEFEKADADHDGTLDATELEQLRKNLAIATKP
jgi:hypothetical protein